jgi:hypothetical protein
MRTQRPAPLTGNELRTLRDRFGSDRLARLLLWEIARLRNVVMVLFRQVCRLSYHRPDEPAIDLDEETESAINAEPVIIENSQPGRDNFKYGRKNRWPHMSAEAESALAEKMEAEADGQLTERDLKRRSREAR